MTLKTDVESGASGYSVTGGGDQGIFVKQVLKDSSAAKLFNLREGTAALLSLGSVISMRMGGGNRETWGGGVASPEAQDGLWSLLSHFRLKELTVP